MTPRDSRDDEEREGKPAPVIITDKRHSREFEEVEEAASTAPEPPAPVEEPMQAESPTPSEPTAPPSEPEPAQPPAGVVEFPGAAGDPPPADPEPIPQQPSEPSAEMTDEESYAQAEMEHLRMLFGAGLVNYLRSQLGLLLNFALIHLGRAPNPATGLVSTELDKAKLAIDLLEFMAAKLKGQLPAKEEQEITHVVAELKYTFLQLASSAPAPPAGNGGDEA